MENRNRIDEDKEQEKKKGKRLETQLQHSSYDKLEFQLFCITTLKHLFLEGTQVLILHNLFENLNWTCKRISDVLLL